MCQAAATSLLAMAEVPPPPPPSGPPRFSSFVGVDSSRAASLIALGMWEPHTMSYTPETSSPNARAPSQEHAVKSEFAGRQTPAQ